MRDFCCRPTMSLPVRIIMLDDSLRVDGSVVLPLYDNVSGVPHNGPSWMGQKKRASLSWYSLLRGATRNRNLTISGWISLMYLLAKEVISRYCSTGGLQYFAVSCGVDFLLLYKGNALFWNTSRCLVFLLHLSVGFIFLSKLRSMTLAFSV